MPNRLAGEASPYLRQHAENPVDWYPWGPEALALARAHQRPILVSIGYSACHWCHVMAHESFEDSETAGLMNALFVNVKVDREERPDVDAIYMEAVQAMTGHGGWPLNVFLTPDGRPFFGGTYFPPSSRHGLPSWSQVLEGVATAFRERPEDVERNAISLTRYLEQMQRLGADEGAVSASLVERAYRAIVGDFDPVDGGFGQAPKFPQPLALEFVLRVASQVGDGTAVDLARLALDRMAGGGIHDQLGGGFHRYSVDAHWLVPHFEKMLYDNALLSLVYLHAFQLTGNQSYRHVSEETLGYMLRELQTPEGGFYSAQDADSEGGEGKFYVWSAEEVSAVLPRGRAELALRRYGIAPGGNFEGKNILTLAADARRLAETTGMDIQTVQHELAEVRSTLLEVRSRRVHPATDTKILTSWNALAVRALAEAGSALDRADLIESAERCAHFLLTELCPAGRLVRCIRRDAAPIPGFLEDYGFLSEALITLYESTGTLQYLDRATQLADEALTRFWDEDRGTFFDASEPCDLIVRPRSLFDNPIPSGNASIIFALQRLGAFTSEERFERAVERSLRIEPNLLQRASHSVPYLLSVLDFRLRGPLQIAVVPGPASPADRLIRTVRERYLPNLALAVGAGERPSLLAGRTAIDGRATAYVCRTFVCDLPVTDAEALASRLAIVSPGFSRT
jgi:uncharacterized protein YyaL (SSP411 family)